MIPKTRFRAVCFFALGAFVWSGIIEATLMFGGTPTFSALALLLSIVGILLVVFGLQHEERWYKEEEGKKR